MDERSDSTKDATPETAAVTGGVSPAAEPPPTTRGRASTAAASMWLSIGLGIALIVTALIADQGSDLTLGAVIAGGALLAIGVTALAGVLGTVLLAVLGFAAGVLLTILAFASGEDFGAVQLVMLVAGAAMFIGSFASLAAARRPGRGEDEPRPGVESV